MNNHLDEIDNSIEETGVVDDNLHTVSSRKEATMPDMAKLLMKLAGMSVVEAVALLGDLGQISLAGLKELFDGLRRGESDWEKWFYKYVPNHVDDKTLLGLFSLMSVKGMDSSVRQMNYTKNLVGWDEYTKRFPGDKFIEHQNQMSDIFYGNHMASYNACEVIAVYNTLLKCNAGKATVSFPQLLNVFEENGITMNGDYGTSPKALYKYLEKNGYEAKLISGGEINVRKLDKMQRDYTCFMLTTYNDRNDLNKMVHTVSITREDEGYVIHNAGDAGGYASLNDAIDNYGDGKGEPICVIGIR